MIREGDKKGLSTIVAILITILLVLIAVAILWTVIRAFILKSTDEITLSKFTVDLKIDSVRIINETINVRVIRNPGEGDLKGISFIVFDGINSKIIEKTGNNFSLQSLEKKTYTFNYTGSIIKISIAPMFQTESGKLITGSITDVYYINFGINGSQIIANCTPDCGIRQCGPVPNECGLSCGSCPPEQPNCQNGICTANPCNPGCMCAQSTCIGQSCLGGCGENCPGELTLEQDCGTTMCGISPSGCGDCGSCEIGYHCDGGICVVSCIADCGSYNCGLVPNRCGEYCGLCDVANGEWCDSDLGPGEAGYCSNETCEQDCTGRNCGLDPVCGESCGTCIGLDSCNSTGQCVSETYLNTGEVYSVWPITIGIYFDSEDLPKEGVDYTDYYVKFTTGSETRCLQIREFVVPVIPAVYNMSHIRFVTSSTDVSAGDTYEIWETYEGCTG